MTNDVDATSAELPDKTKAPATRRHSAGKTPQTKQQQLIRMLSTKAGADIASASQKLGWLPHTTRAALSGLKKAGYVITVEKGGECKPSRYRIVSEAEASSAPEAQ